jgi:hypothetical protein
MPRIWHPSCRGHPPDRSWTCEGCWALPERRRSWSSAGWRHPAQPAIASLGCQSSLPRLKADPGSPLGAGDQRRLIIPAARTSSRRQRGWDHHRRPPAPGRRRRRSFADSRRHATTRPALALQQRAHRHAAESLVQTGRQVEASPLLRPRARGDRPQSRHRRPSRRSSRESQALHFTGTGRPAPTEWDGSRTSRKRQAQGDRPCQMAPTPKGWSPSIQEGITLRSPPPPSPPSTGTVGSLDGQSASRSPGFRQGRKSSGSAPPDPAG